MRLITPTQTASSLESIDLCSLKSRGIKLLLLDIDNTIIPRGDKEAPAEIINWLIEAKQIDLKICLMSNNTKKRFPDLDKYVDDYAIFSRKPFKINYKRLLRKFEMKEKETVMIGDQIFTDILGANRLGLHTILVRRQRNYGKFTRKILHWFEDKLWEKF